MSSPDEKLRISARRWTVVAVAIASLALASFALTAIASLRPCRGALVKASVPPGWEQLTPGPLGSFVFSGTPPAYPQKELRDPARRFDDAYVYDPQLCSVPRSGIDAFPTYEPSTLRLRTDEASGTFVVTGTRPSSAWQPIDERSPFVAFKRSSLPRFVFTSERWRALGIALGVALAVSASFARGARRSMRHADHPPALKNARTHGISALVFLLFTLLVLSGGWIGLELLEALAESSA